MSDLAAAAAAMGVPEELVKRSAEARAQETGASVEEILAAWAGGGAAPASVAAEAAPEVTATPEPEAPTAAPEVVVEVPLVEAQPAPSAVAAAPGKPPVLVGSGDNPLWIMAAAVGLFALIFLVGFLGPSLQTETPGARSSEIDFSETALDGKDLYSSLGCAACHTQMVRPVVADVGLGGVTLNDSNQPLGTRRFGPDLSDIGSRVDADELQAVVGGSGGHQQWSLSNDDLEAIVAYLTESRTEGVRTVEKPEDEAPGDKVAGRRYPGDWTAFQAAGHHVTGDGVLGDVFREPRLVSVWRDS